MGKDDRRPRRKDIAGAERKKKKADNKDMQLSLGINQYSSELNEEKPSDPICVSDPMRQTGPALVPTTEYQYAARNGRIKQEKKGKKENIDVDSSEHPLCFMGLFSCVE